MDVVVLDIGVELLAFLLDITARHQVITLDTAVRLAGIRVRLVENTYLALLAGHDEAAAAGTFAT